MLLKLSGRKGDTYNQRDYATGAAVGGNGVPYDVVVHCYSNLIFKARATQSGFDPGSKSACMQP